MSKTKQVKVVPADGDEKVKKITQTVIARGDPNDEETVANITVDKFKKIKITLTIYIEPPDVDEE